MKFLATFKILLLYCFASFAQQNFEGNIAYSVTTSNDTSNDGFLKISLKEGKMLIISNAIKGKPLHAIYDFNKGERYDISQIDSTAISNKLTMSPFTEQKGSEVRSDDLFQFKDYTARKISLNIPAGMNRNFKLMEAWFSPKIIFKVPASFRLIVPPFAFLNDSSISLKVKIVLSGLTDLSAEQVTFTIEATSIDSKILSDSIFEIPTYFKIMTQKEYINNLLKKFKQIDADLQNQRPGTNKEQ